jgi:hypothetical protein
VSLQCHLESMLQDMHAALAANLYRPALLVALTLPDICVGLTMDEFEPVKKFHYVDFIDRHSVRSDLGFSGSECYELRCGMLHSGNAAWHKRLREMYIIFSTSRCDSAVHGEKLSLQGKKADVFNISKFCGAIEAATWNWFAEHKEHPRVVARARYLLKWRPDGLSPFLPGAPVLASGE